MSKSAAQKRAERAALKPLLVAENIRRAANGRKPINMMAFKAKLKKDRLKAAGPPKWSFYATQEWKELRYQALVNSSGRCLACGASAADGAVLRVDHIIPISKAPHLKADPNNLQVLCNACNWGKGGHDSTDWRNREIDPRYGKLTIISNNGK